MLLELAQEAVAVVLGMAEGEIPQPQHLRRVARYAAHGRADARDIVVKIVGRRAKLGGKETVDEDRNAIPLSGG